MVKIKIEINTSTVKHTGMTYAKKKNSAVYEQF